jgi:hypothetical protein
MLAKRGSNPNASAYIGSRIQIYHNQLKDVASPTGRGSNPTEHHRAASGCDTAA